MPFTPFNNYRTSIMPFPQFSQPLFSSLLLSGPFYGIVLFDLRNCVDCDFFLFFFFSFLLYWLKNYGKFTWKWVKNDWQPCTSIDHNDKNILGMAATTTEKEKKNDWKMNIKRFFLIFFFFFRKETGRNGQLSYHFDRNLVQWRHSVLWRGECRIFYVIHIKYVRTRICKLL